ncbi:PLP-dependent aminotransferase family protein [Oceanospirillum beijerinckii]|uniref:aminotransferase-like domain-containing protein n=1 Tax=Oceanospirillum beijerinckii TaxID=64976 RepID=UPI0004150751|nr:PLP-dependent aminotransferase family protein [Oceanospirillum beijerinckii]
MTSTLYQQIADDLARQIDEGSFQAGDKLPSIRKLSQQKQVSIATIQSAYELLERQQLIESRPQSGFYVREVIKTDLPAGEIQDNLQLPTRVSIKRTATEVLQRCQQPDMINLGTAIPSPEFLPVKQLQRIMGSLIRKRMDEVVVSVFPPGLLELRIQIAKRMAESGCRVSASEIVITNGCQEALTLCLRAVAEPGDIIAIESPAFVGLLQTIEALGMRAMEIPTDPRKGISLDALQLALEQWPIKAVALVPTNNNPLGFTMPDEHRQRLLTMLAKKEIPVIEDDLFGDLNYSGSRPKAIKAYDENGQVLYCSSVSKSIASGLRVGWVSAGRYQSQIEFLKSFSSVGTSTLSQMAVAEFLANGGYDRHLRRIQSAYAKQVQKMSEAVLKYFPAGTSVSYPQGGYILWVVLPTGIDTLQLHYKALDDNIGIMPGEMFSARDQYQNSLRLNCAIPWSDKVEQAIKSLGQLAVSG